MGARPSCDKQSLPSRLISIEGVDDAFLYGSRRRISRVTSYKSRIEDRLRAAFNPARLEVFDESAKHHGHSGWREGGETHFRIVIEADAFTGKSRVETHRAINQALSAELSERVHALAIEARGLPSA
jgi:BolA protein